MIASYLSSPYLFLCNLFAIFFFTALTYSAKVYIFLWHLRSLPYILQLGDLTQPTGIVRSTDIKK
jgi:hypothetical protein